MKIKVLLVDDHKVLRTGLRLLLELQPDIAVVGEAECEENAWTIINKASPDVVVMDIQLPGENGVQISKKILSERPSMRIVILSALADFSVASEALKAGILGYVLKSNGHEEVLRAVRMAMDGKMYIDPELNAMVLQDYKKYLIGENKSETPALSDREIEILKFIANGLRNKEIADRLNVSPKSVETYKRRLLVKLGYKNTADLIRYAIQKGMVSP